MQGPVPPVEATIRLRCISEGGRLRIKILSKGFSHEANCQFPKNIRLEGREFLVPREDISMVETRGKFFYRIKKNRIQICEIDGVVGIDASGLKDLRVFEDPELTDCVVCMEDKDPVAGFMIYVPCGHACACRKCSDRLKDCPMCRTPISQKITKSQLQ